MAAQAGTGDTRDSGLYQLDPEAPGKHVVGQPLIVDGAQAQMAEAHVTNISTEGGTHCQR